MGDRAAAESGGSVAEETDAQPGSGSQSSDSGPDYTPPAVSRRPLGCLIEIAETLILTIVIFWVIQTFIAQPYKVQQESMRDTLEPDEYVLVDKLTPHFDSYSRGDIIVFNPVVHIDTCTSATDPVEGEGDTPFIKRVIGEPGDTVELRNGSVFVNGAEVDEPYIDGARTSELGDGTTWTVAADRLFVMGDNRNNSTDSRAFGPICVGDVIGKAWLRYWPLNTIGILQTPTYPDIPPATVTP